MQPRFEKAGPDPHLVALRQEREVRYPAQGPFHPPQAYPEYPWGPRLLQPENRVYSLVRDLLYLLGLDRPNFGTEHWNPLGELIRPGDRVVIKPNFVTDLHRTQPQCWESRLALFTHGSVLRPVVDYAFKACGEQGLITICDSPVEEFRPESFRNVSRDSGTAAMVEALQELGVPVRLLDLRDGIYSSYGAVRRIMELPGDPLGYTLIDLGAESLLEEISGDFEKFETGAWKKVGAYHHPGHHRYSISNTVLQADVFINVPKLKTHKKTGVSLCLKNVMGISNRKDWVPHWRRGIDEHRDADPFYLALVKSSFNCSNHTYHRVLSKLIGWAGIKPNGYGNWHGNDTIWRIPIDLNKILFFADKSGKITENLQRRYLAVVDGIMAGEGDSPLAPQPRPFGAVLAGVDPLAVSRIGCDLMGVDYRLIKKIVGARSLTRHPFSDRDLENIQVVGDAPATCGESFQMARNWEIVAKNQA